ncbi:MAG: RDD family protein [Terriglobales bacterium]
MTGTFFCNKCGAPNDGSAQFCGRCGSAINPAVAAAPGVDPPASATFPPAAPVPASGYPAPPAYPVTQAGVRYGGFWIRVVAVIIDAILVRVVVHPVAAIFGIGGLAVSGLGLGLGHGVASLPLLIFGGGVLALLTIGASWLYEALMESSSYQATLGKMIFGMKVTDVYGNRISFARATGRHFAKILSGMILGIGFIMVGLSERKQGLHDLLAGTLVRR